MKQTNSAIKFLMAQYRAIFKHAYLKGLVSATILTVGLAVSTSSASAVEFDPANAFSGEISFVDPTKFTMDGVEYIIPANSGITISPDDGDNLGINFTGAKSETVFKFNNAIFNVHTEDHAGYGARVSFGQGTFNFTGDNNHFAELLTLDAGNITNDASKTITLTGGGELHIDGYLSISMGAGDNKVDMSGVDVFIKNLDTPKTQGQLIIDPSITVGNLTFEGESHINLYKDEANWTANSSNTGSYSFSPDKTIYIADGKAVTFASGSHIITSIIADSSSYTLTFSKVADAKSANVENEANSSLTVSRALTIDNGVHFENSGAIKLNSNLNINSGASFNNTTGAKVTVSGSSILDIKSGSKFSNKGEIEVAAGAGFTLAGDAVTPSRVYSGDDFTFNIIDLKTALGNFTSSGVLTLARGGDTKTDYTFETDTDTLESLGVDFSKEPTAGDETENIVLHGTSLQVKDDLDVSSAKLAAYVSGEAVSGLNDDGEFDPELISLETLAFTTTNGATSEDLNGLKLVGIEGLEFVSGKTDNSDDEAILVSGGGIPNTVFISSGDVKSSGSKPLTFQNATLVLDDTTYDTALRTGEVEVDLTFNAGSFDVYNGEWTAQNITLTNGSNFELVNDSATFPASLTAKKIVATGSELEVTGGQLTANSISLDSSTLAATDKSVISIKGDGSGGTVDLVGGTAITIANSSLNLNYVDDTVGMTFTSGSGAGSGFAMKADKIDATNAEIYVNLSNVSGAGAMSIAQANGLLGVFTDGTGFVHIEGDVKPAIDDYITEESGENVISFDDIASGGSLNLTFDTEQTQNTIIKDVTGSVTGGWKAVQTFGSGNAASVGANGTLMVYGADNGNFAQDSSGAVVGFELKEDALLVLNNSGSTGTISGTSGSVVEVKSGAVVSVVNKDGTAADIKSLETLKSSGAITANLVDVKNVDFSSGSVVSAKTIKTSEKMSLTGGAVVQASTIEGKLAEVSSSQVIADSIDVDTFTVDNQSTVDLTGTENATGTLEAKQITLKGDSNVKVKKIALGSGGTLQVGQDKTVDSGSSSANLVAEVIELNNGMLIVDPDYNQKTATVFAKQIGDITGSEMVVDGHILVGQNSALGIGGDEASFRESLAKYQTNGSLSSSLYGSYVYINRAGINLGSKKMVIAAESLDKLKTYAAGTDSIYFGADSAMQVSAKAMQEAGDGTVFTSLTASESIKSTDGTLIVPANMSSDQVAKIFGDTVVLTSGSAIKVTTENGLYTGVIDSSDELHGVGFTLSLASDARSILSGLSNPTYDYITNVMSTDSKHYDDEKAFNDAVKNEAAANPPVQSSQIYGANGVAILDDSMGYQFLQDALGSVNSAAIEQGARLASFGGAVQAIQTASNSTTDAINGRLGMGNSAARLTVADNAQSAALWVAPVYRNFSSESFDASGLGYGADVDLFGAALGADYTLSNGLRVGGMFNVGSGDADGNGAGAGVSNDFSYYGLALYAGFSPMENLSLTTDVSYTVVDNDLEASTNILDYGKFAASTDSTAWSLGVGAQYVLKSSIDVAPHVGLRYTSLDVDDYDVKIDGVTVANTTGDTAGVFSIPVGVSLSKDITAGTWTVRPAADFTVTFNFGDDEMTSSTTFDGVMGDAVRYNTEFGDTVTYGAAFGVSAKSGNFNFGLNAGYTASSNTDEYTVGANARFVF